MANKFFKQTIYCLYRIRNIFYYQLNAISLEQNPFANDNRAV